MKIFSFLLTSNPIQAIARSESRRRILAGNSTMTIADRKYHKILQTDKIFVCWKDFNRLKATVRAHHSYYSHFIVGIEKRTTDFFLCEVFNLLPGNLHRNAWCNICSKSSVQYDYYVWDWASQIPYGHYWTPYRRWDSIRLFGIWPETWWEAWKMVRTGTTPHNDRPRQSLRTEETLRLSSWAK